MEWLRENWFWLFVLVMFSRMCMGGHGRHSRSSAGEPHNAGEEGIGSDDQEHTGGGDHAQH